MTGVTESLLKILKMALRILKAMALGAQVWIGVTFCVKKMLISMCAYSSDV